MKKRGSLKTYAIFAFMCIGGGWAIPSPSFAESLQNPTAVLSGLDKITGTTKTFPLNVGKEGSFGSLQITLKACLTQPPTESQKTWGFLDIFEKTPTGERNLIFSGWMLAQSPALNPLEHPIYDIWLVGCKDPKKQPPPKTNFAEPDENTSPDDIIPKDND